MTNISKFKRELQGAVQIRVDQAGAHMTKLAATVAFTHLTTPGVWPIDTYYSIANHKISLNGDPIGSPVPATRPDAEGSQLTGRAESNKQRQLGKLKAIKKSQVIVLIGNPVEYAADVGFQVSQGKAIYAEAARFASRMVAAEKVTNETLAKSGGSLI